jgi:hypothetical protein
MTEGKTPFDQGMEMWERMSASYMDTMTKAVEQTMEQSTAFRKQVDKSVATAMSVQLEASLAAIKALEQQVQLLATKIDQLLQKQG